MNSFNAHHHSRTTNVFTPEKCSLRLKSDYLWQNFLIKHKNIAWSDKKFEDDTLKVIELKLGTPDSEVTSGIHYLAKKMKL
jgi:hypothetical protein